MMHRAHVIDRSVFVVAVVTFGLAVAMHARRETPVSTQTSGYPPPRTRTAFDIVHSEVFNSDGSPKYLPPPPPDSRGAIVLSYDDFGPQAMAWQLLGNGWWQWAECACFEPDDSFDVRVVVYRGRALEDIELAYPTIRNVHDFRYVTYDETMSYIDDQLKELTDFREPEDAEWTANISRELEQLRTRIVAGLGRRNIGA